MDPGLSIRQFSADEWRVYRELRLRALGDSPDAFGSTLEREEAGTDREWATRLASGVESATNLPLIAQVEGRPAGLAWGRIEPSAPETAHLFQMWVSPAHRGLGAGRLLVDAVIDWARSKHARQLVLGVTCGDTPATRLYARAGFVPDGEPEPIRPGSTLLAQPMRLVLEESGSFAFERSSALAVAPEILWRHAVSPAGVNRELRPLLRMTFPKQIESLAESWQPGERLFRCWLLLGGVLPVEYDDLAFVAVEPGRRFLERSSLLSQRVWEHERVIEPVAGGSWLTDRIRFVPRLRWLGPVHRMVFALVFALRHRNLRRIFGELAAR